MLQPIKKSQPTQSDVHIDGIQTNVSVAYIRNQTQYIADKVFPVVPVEHQSNKYTTYNKNDWLRDEAQKRADSTESVGSGYGVSTASYFADVWAIHKDIGDQTRANADSQFNLDREATEFVTQRLLLRREIQWASDFFKTTVWGTDTTPANLWSDYGASDPIDDIDAAKQTIASTTGFSPNTLVLGYNAFRKLKNHPDLVDRFKYTNSESLTEQILARMFGVERVFVADAIKATNVEAETAAYSFVIAANSALLVYVAPNPGLLSPSAGYTFSWRRYLGQDISISRFRIEEKKTDRIEGEMAYSNKLVGTDLGVFFSSAVA